MGIGKRILMNKAVENTPVNWWTIIVYVIMLIITGLIMSVFLMFTIWIFSI